MKTDWTADLCCSRSSTSLGWLEYILVTPLLNVRDSNSRLFNETGNLKFFFKKTGKLTGCAIHPPSLTSPSRLALSMVPNRQSIPTIYSLDNLMSFTTYLLNITEKLGINLRFHFAMLQLFNIILCIENVFSLNLYSNDLTYTCFIRPCPNNNIINVNPLFWTS